MLYDVIKNRVGCEGEGEVLDLHAYFNIRHDQNGRSVSYTRRPHFIPKEILWYSFRLEAEWNPGLLNVERRNRPLENVSKNSIGNRTRGF